MEPVSALIIALTVAWAITRGASDAAVAQAAQEARDAAEAIRGDLRDRAEEWAETLAGRVAGGRSGGPATGLWWAWAGVRCGKGIRHRLRREPREGERARRGTTGPWRRIIDAAMAGARYAREETRARRESRRSKEQPAGERSTPPRLGVCARCGAVVARQALADAVVGPGRRRLRVCVTCRADRAAREEAAPDAASTDLPEIDDVVDAEVVDDASDQPRRPEIDASQPALNSPTAEDTTTDPDLGSSSRPVIPAPAPRHNQGEPMAPRTPGQLVPRKHIPARSARTTRGTGGESYTHGQWNRAVTDVEQHLADLPAALEMMLHRLTTAEAGRSQVNGVIALGDEIVVFMKQVNEMLTEVNRMEGPVLRAVEAAGGPDEIAGIPYLREV